MSAAVKLKVTAIKCPSCEGSVLFFCIPFTNEVTCTWCNGAKRLPTEAAKRFAFNLHIIADGGFFAVDHDHQHRRHFEAKAEGIYHLIGEVPSWKSELLEPPCGEQG